MDYLENPFPREAVSTFGKQKKRITAPLSYLPKATRLVDDYLISYPKQDKRYGGGIGIRGGHGSGKTHLLNYQAEHIGEFTRVKRVTIAYAKADTNRFFDLHKQFMKQISRERIIELIDTAGKIVAKKEARRAYATESLAPHIESGDNVETLKSEGILDANFLNLALQKKLQGSEVPKTIPSVLLMVDTTLSGRKAHSWLEGNVEPELDKWGFQPSLTSLSQITDSKDADIASELVVIQTIETIAALHELAEEPLILLVDQLEMLLRADDSYKETLFSLLKKFVEDVNAHNGLILIAGNEESWKLRRDVGPRMITREPITIGNLDLAETTILLNAYLKAEGHDEKFSQASMSMIRDLSGGNPREILLIAYHAFNHTDGNISSIAEDLLIRSAKDSGSIADRELLALEIIDRTMSQYGIVRPPVDLGDGSVMQRILTVDDQPRIGVMTITARDRLEEVDSARLVNKSKDKFMRIWPAAHLFVVAVGYSSREIRDLLKLRTRVVVFDGYDKFTNEVNTFVIDALAQQLSQTDKLEDAEAISEDLDRIEISREQKQLEAERNFQLGVENLEERRLLTQQAETRWGLLEQIDQLEDFLVRQKDTLSESFTVSSYASVSSSESSSESNERRYFENIITERSIMRSMLIGNEAGLENADFDFVGGVYLDVLSLELSTPHISANYTFDLLMNRFRILGEMRKLLRSSNDIFSFLRKHHVLLSIIVGFLAFVVAGIYYIRSFPSYLLPDVGFWAIIAEIAPSMLLAGIAGAGFTYLIIWMYNYFRKSRWNQILTNSERLIRYSNRETFSDSHCCALGSKLTH
jgi:hypothetical protein